MRTLLTGDAVYVGQSWGWSDSRYISGVVSKITPSGRITVTIPAQYEFVEHKLVFSKDGKELGNRYRGKWIDDETPETRAQMIKERIRVDAASAAIRAIANGIPTNRDHRERESLLAEWKTIKALFEKAEALVVNLERA